MNINRKRSNVVCINGVKKGRRWKINGCKIGEYRGVTENACLNVF